MINSEMHKSYASLLIASHAERPGSRPSDRARSRVGRTGRVVVHLLFRDDDAVFLLFFICELPTYLYQTCL